MRGDERALAYSALRAVLVVVFCAGIGIAIADVATPSPQTSAFTRNLSPVAGRVDTYRLEDRAGLTTREGRAEIGDLLRLIDPTPERRLLVVAPGVPMRFVDLRTGITVTITDTQPRAPSLHPWKVLRVGIELTALLLVLLRGTMPPVLGLATFLFFNQFTTPAMTGAYLGSWWRVAYKVMQDPLTGSVTSIGLIVLASGFAPSSRQQRLAVRTLIAIAIAWLAIDLAVSARLLLGGPYVDWVNADRSMELFLTLAAMVLFVRGIAASHGTERRRLVVLATAVAIGQSIDLYGFFGPNLYNPVQVTFQLAALTVMTIGLAYAILVHRLFDIGFVINRAVVFAVISAIVLPIFVLIEFVLGTQAEQFGGSGGTRAIGLAIAVAIGVILRPLHRRVDVFVDSVLFAARHRNANAILAFAADCDDIETQAALLQRTIEAVKRFGRVSGCALLLSDDHGNLHEAISWNLPIEPLSRDTLVALRLRNSRQPLERGSGSPLDVADAAFPIPGRHRLAGALLCERPHRAEPYSPEEFGALQKLAHDLGTALLAIDAADARRLRGELATLRERARRPAHRHR